LAILVGDLLDIIVRREAGRHLSARRLEGTNNIQGEPIVLAVVAIFFRRAFKPIEGKIRPEKAFPDPGGGPWSLRIRGHTLMPVVEIIPITVPPGAVLTTAESSGKASCSQPIPLIGMVLSDA
jgi:hypothetical protein